MARPTGRLTALRVSRESKSGMYADGGGLYLQVTKATAKSWIYRYSLAGKAREMGLGSLADVTLAEARTAATGYRKLRGEGVDPIASRESARAAKALEAAKAVTFQEAAERYIEAHNPGWKNDKHKAQWPQTLESYVYPAIGDLPVQSIDTDQIWKVIEPLWRTKTETASRVRGRIEVILDWAKVRGLRTGENPARWRGHLSHLLPAKSRVHKVQHHPALPYAELPGFMGELRALPSAGARALELTVLTASRTEMTIGAKWSEIDFANKAWTVPGIRMKTGQEHRIPLTDRAVAILQEMHEVRISDYIFPGLRSGKGLSNAAMSGTLQRMGRTGITVHGFRSTFKDWAAERTDFPNHVSEMALAHAIGDEVEAAYRRGDLFEWRIKLMDAWAGYCASPVAAAGNVVPIGGEQ